MIDPHLVSNHLRRLWPVLAALASFSAVALLEPACSESAGLGGSAGRADEDADADVEGSAGDEDVPETGSDVGFGDGDLEGGADDADGTGDAAGDAIEDAPAQSCDFEAGVERGKLSSAEIVEASGLVASRKNAHVLWTHNDSGDSARIFAIRDDAALLGTFTLTGVTAVDFEDIALGPGPGDGESYVYVGDIGDNREQRAEIVVHRIAEPDVDASTPLASPVAVASEPLRLVYPDGAHNAETLLSDPRTADLYVVTKSLNGSRVYRARAPFSTDGPTTLEYVTSLAFGQAPLAGDPLATGGDIAASGAIVIRTYRAAFLWRRGPGTSVDAALAEPPCPVPLAPDSAEPQGEAIAFAADESGYFTLGEGERAPLFFFAKVAP